MKSFLSSGSCISPSQWRNLWLLLLAVLPCNWGIIAARGETGSNRMLNVFTRDEGGITHFYVQNLEIGDVTTTFEMELLNMAGSTNFPYTTTLAGNQTVEVFTLAPIKKDAACNYSYINSCMLGSVTAVHDDAHVYCLPYAPGSSFRVSQGYHGTFSHTGPDEYAIDWKMPMGTPVYAAREGLVVKSKDDSNTGGPDRKYLNCANCILIQHPDGTIGIYGHLKQGGNKVKVGDKVKTGDLIGLSGNTGFAKGPHLHFAVFKSRNGSERMSLSVKFCTAENAALTLTNGQSYKAPFNTEPQLVDHPPLATAEPKKTRSGG